jgi:hypothetical protein
LNSKLCAFEGNKDVVYSIESFISILGTMIELLEHKSLVERQPDPSDGRARLVFLTKNGRERQPTQEELGRSP